MRLLAVSAAVLLGSSAAFAFQSSANPCARPGTPPIVHPLPPAPAATLTSYTDHMLWSAAVGTATTLVDFETIADGTQITNNLSSFGITLVSGDSINESPAGPTTQFVSSSQTLPFPMFIVGTLHSETKFISNRLSPGVYATGTMTFTFAVPTSAVGAWVADQSPLGNTDIELFNGATSLGSVSLPPQTSPASFVGVVSATPFTAAKFSSTSPYDSWGLDDVEFGGSSAVPTFCYGDGTGTACPCGNTGAAGNGCASSVSPGGANLAGSGNPSVSQDSFALTGTLMPNSAALYFQGTLQTAGGAGTVFGDGLRCAGGSITRIGTKLNVGGTSHYPAPGDAAISVKGGDSAGAQRTYQCWYRNAAAFCTPSTFNLTNGVQITWAP